MDIKYQLYDTLNYQNAPSAISSNAVTTDRNGTHFRHILSRDKTMLYNENKTDYYTILFTFPDDFLDAKYSSVIELIEVNVESQQVLASDT